MVVGYLARDAQQQAGQQEAGIARSMRGMFEHHEATIKSFARTCKSVASLKYMTGSSTLALDMLRVALDVSILARPGGRAQRYVGNAMTFNVFRRSLRELQEIISPGIRANQLRG